MSDTASPHDRLNRLAIALRGLGLEAVISDTVLTATNPAVPATDARSVPMFSGLSQEVVLHDDDNGTPMWAWVWPAPRPARQGDPVLPPDIEAMCPAQDIAGAAGRIARVIRANGPVVAP